MSSAGPSTFLNILNPMNSNYHGYTQASQSVSDGNEGSNDHEDIDLEPGRSTVFHGPHEPRPSSRVLGKRRVAWDPGASEMSNFHPNIQKEDRIPEEDSSDDEVPQSFMVEPASRPSVSPKFSDKLGQSGRNQALYSTDGRKLPPILPTTVDQLPSSGPSRSPALNLDVDDEQYPRTATPSQGSSTASRPLRPAMRGLDDYEKALWNWVNVYDLDAFLQEVYAYYEGKGIYSIALARGLNLL